MTVFSISDRASYELGFDEVKRRLVDFCITPFGKETLESEWFLASIESTRVRSAAAIEAASLIDENAPVLFGGVADLRPLLKWIEKEAVLGAGDVLEVAKTLQATTRLRRLLESRNDTLPHIWRIAERLDEDTRFTDKTLRAFDDEGALTDGASKTLLELRTRVRSLRKQAKEKLSGLVRKHFDDEILRDDTFTLRNDRYVLPVISGFQHRVEGIVHDASQSGQTVFIEPRALLEVGNKIMIAKAQVKEEETRILSQMTHDVRELAPRIKNDLAAIGQLEATMARGRLAFDVGGAVVTPEAGAAFSLREARHPILLLQEDKSKVIANDILMDGYQALIISGPNAGGKTVALKTAALLVLMSHAGLPIPCDETSSVPKFTHILSSVGDAQDLERGLSSFSGHLEILQDIVENAAKTKGNALVLIDEIASGTDPSQGATIAQAVLENIVEQGATVIATTHYERLKLFGLENQSVQNASVGLDAKTHRPTYHLALGEVGTSNAYEAATRHGLNESIIERARSLLTPDERGVQEMLSGLKAERDSLRQKSQAAADEYKSLEQERQKLQLRLREVEAEADKLRREGAKIFMGEISEARSMIASAIEKVRNDASPKTLNEMSHALKKEEERLAEKAKAPASEVAPELRVGALKAGDKVRLSTMGNAEVTVVEDEGNQVLVARGAMKMRVSRDALRKGSANSSKNAGKNKKHVKKAKPSLPQATSPRTTATTLDIRGERLGDALELIDAFLDHVLKKGGQRAWILHGHGTGALKRGVRDALSASVYVSSFGAASSDDGGDALTEVQLA